MSTELATRNGSAVVERPVDPAIVTEEHRKILREMVDKNATPTQIEMLMLVGNRYDLDPLLGHVVLIQGKVFVTHKGLLHKAHTSGQFDGLETSYGQDEIGPWCESKVYRKDMGRPFTGRIYINEYKNSNPTWGKLPSAMGAKTAESFTMRRAFDISLTSAEEMGMYDPPAPRPPDAPRPAIAAPPVNEFPSQRGAAQPEKPQRPPESAALLAKVTSAIKASLDEAQIAELKAQHGPLAKLSDEQLGQVYAQIEAINAAKIEAADEVEGDPFAPGQE